MGKFKKYPEYTWGNNTEQALTIKKLFIKNSMHPGTGLEMMRVCGNDSQIDVFLYLNPEKVVPLTKIDSILEAIKALNPGRHIRGIFFTVTHGYRSENEKIFRKADEVLGKGKLLGVET